MGVVNVGVYNSGLLARPTISDDAHYNYAPAPQEILDHARQLAACCAEYGVELPTAALQFSLLHPAVRTVVVGASNPGQIEQNIARMNRARSGGTVGGAATPVAGAGVTFRVDAHLHLWNLESGGYGWLGPQHGPLHRSFSAEEARQELASSGVDRAILVQADDTLADTRAMLDAAHNNDWIAGVVGWIRLDTPEEAERQLHDWLDEPGFCGIRHLVHGDPRDDFLALPAVRESLKGVAAAGIPFDVPDAWPRHLSAAADLAEAIPELTVIIDHLGKPPLGTR